MRLLPSLILSVIGAASLVACNPGNVKPIPLQKALVDMQEGLGDSALTMLEIASEDDVRPGGTSPVYKKLARFQCGLTPTGDPIPGKSPVRNPVIPLVNGAVQVQVQGQISDTGTVALAVLPAVLTATASKTHQNQEQFMLPVAFVTLADLPGYYINQELPTLQGAAALKTLPPQLPPPPAGSPPAPPQMQDFGSNWVAQQTEKVVHNIAVITAAALEQFHDDKAYCAKVTNVTNASADTKIKVESVLKELPQRVLTLPPTVDGVPLQ
jgi:hypothetical protein